MISVHNLGEYFSFVIYIKGTNNNVMCLFPRVLHIIYKIRDFFLQKSCLLHTHFVCIAAQVT